MDGYEWPYPPRRSQDAAVRVGVVVVPDVRGQDVP